MLGLFWLIQLIQTYQLLDPPNFTPTLQSVTGAEYLNKALELFYLNVHVQIVYCLSNRFCQCFLLLCVIEGFHCSRKYKLNTYCLIDQALKHLCFKTEKKNVYLNKIFATFYPISCCCCKFI